LINLKLKRKQKKVDQLRRKIFNLSLQ
jgi:hypothetical protein